MSRFSDMRALLLLILLLVPAGAAHAIFYNNTETIEIGDGSLPEASPDSTYDSGSNGTPGGGSGPGSQPGGTPVDTQEPEPEDITNDDDKPSSGTVSGGDTETLVNSLLDGGALSGVSAADSGSGSAGTAGDAGLNVRVIGSKVRQMLSADIDLREILTYWRKGKGKATEAELGLIAASTALRDTNVQEVAFTAGAYEIVYRSRGYLLAIIPWSLPVRVKVIPAAPVLEERVSVKLPWYRFFVRKFFTVKGLQRDIDELITKTKNENTDGDIDETALLFEATAQFLRTKVGTVADSVLLGAPQR
jgi:hypothetical protein